jgi:hypothetical protein
MHPLIETANHILGEALRRVPGGGTVRIRSCELDEAGFKVSAWLDHPQASGELVLRLRIDPPSAALTQAVHIAVERWPERLPPALEPLRAVAEKATLRLDLDFRDLDTGR